MSKWPEARFQGQFGPLPWVSSPKGVAVWGGGRREMEAAQTFSRPLVLLNGAAVGRG